MFKLTRLLYLLIIMLLILGLPRWILRIQYNHAISEPEDAPLMPVAIVFGAGLRRDGRPTTVLADRVSTAARLYHDGKVSRLLMSGSSRDDQYDETGAMRDFAVTLGVDEADILLDPDGDRTFLTCLNARDQFGVTQTLLVSQRYHLPRALVLCQTLGISAVGVSSDLHSYRAQGFWSFREAIAILRAFWDAGTYHLCEAFSKDQSTLG